MSLSAYIKQQQGRTVKPIYAGPTEKKPLPTVKRKTQESDLNLSPELKAEITTGRPITPALKMPTVLNQPIVPKTTNVTAPITGRTFDLGTTVEYKAPKTKADELKQNIKDKYGVDVKGNIPSPIQYVNKLNQYTKGMDKETRAQFDKDFTDYVIAYKADKPFEAGAEAGLNILPTAFESIGKGTQELAETQKKAGYIAGSLTGELAKYGVLYGVAGPVIEKIASKLGVGTGLAGKFGTELAKDVVIGGTTGAVEAGIAGEDVGKTVVNNFVRDVAFNAILLGGGQVVKKVGDLINLKTSKDVISDVAAKLDVPEEEAQKVVNNTVDYYVNQYGVSSTKPFEQLQLPAPKEQGLDAFTQWRKENFGGAYGKLSPEDDIAMKQLYKEDTGIDLLGTKKEVPKTITPDERSLSQVVKEQNLSKQLPVTEQVVEQPVETLSQVVKKKRAPKTKPVVDELQLDQTTKQTIPAPNEQPVIQAVEEAPIKLPAQTIELPKQKSLETPITGESQAKFPNTARESAQTTEELKQKIKQNVLPTTTDEARIDYAKKIVDEDFETALNLVRTGDKFSSDMEGAIGNVIYDRLQQAGRYDDALDVIEGLSRKARKAGQEIQILSLWSKTSPEGMAKWAVKTLNESNVPVDSKVIADVSNQMKSIQEATPEELAKMIQKQVKSKGEKNAIDYFIKNTDGQYLKELNTALVMKNITDKLPIATARQISTVQAMSHLLNAKTFARNILGNVASIGLEQVSKFPASMIDRALSLGTKNRTLVAKMPKWQQSFSEGFSQGKKSVAEIMLGVNRTSQDKYDLFFESAFKDKGLGKLGRLGEKALSVSLSTPDEFFKGFVKADSVYNQVRSRLGKEVDKMNFGEILQNATEQEIKTAVEEARFTTFQNDSLPAKLLTEIKQNLNRIGLGKTTKTGIKEFGLGDLVVKYTRVPGNLIARSIEYSPIGALKALTLMGDLPKNQRQISQILGRAMTGSTLAVLGYNLAKSGIVQTQGDLTYDEAALARSEGKGNYKLNISAMKRLMNGESTEAQAGDVFKSYDWIQPLNVPIAVGAEISKLDGKEKTFEDITRSFGAATMEQALDLPTMFIIQSMMNEARNKDSDAFDVLTVPIKQALPGFVPAVVRQSAQLIDPVIRETRGSNSTETAKNQILANLPFASKTLQPKLSPLGEVQKRQSGLAGALLLPSTTTVYTPAEFSKGLEEIKKLTGSTAQYPSRQAPKKISYRLPFEETKELELSPEEKTLFQETFGQEVKKLYTGILTPNSYKDSRSAEETLKKLKSAESDARELAKNAVLRKRGIK